MKSEDEPAVPGDFSVGHDGSPVVALQA
jgi:hypothetical protein